jgi:hypothetical protein
MVGRAGVEFSDALWREELSDDLKPFGLETAVVEGEEDVVVVVVRDEGSGGSLTERPWWLVELMGEIVVCREEIAEKFWGISL